MHNLCPDAVPAGTAWLDGYELLFEGPANIGYLTCEPDYESRIPLGIWEISDSDIQTLYEYEDYPDLYIKKEIPLVMKEFTTGSEKDITAMIYLMKPGYPCWYPATDYLNDCLKGYDDFGFNPDILIDAVNATNQKIIAG